MNSASPTAYILSDIMTYGTRQEVAYIERALTKAGISYYSPMRNKEINDKQTCDNANLSERIVAADMAKIHRAKLIVCNVRQDAIGSLCEIGTIWEWNHQHPDQRKYFIALSSDIRRTNVPETGDRRSFSYNAFLYGLLLSLTDGQGIIDFSDLPDALAQLKL